MSEEKPLLQLPARLIGVWLVLIVCITGSTMLATAHYITGGSLLIVLSLWAIRAMGIASFWFLPGRTDTKIFAMALVLLSQVLDVVLKLPVIDTVEYGDWFMVSALDLTGEYAGYFMVWGLLLPVLALVGWFVLRSRALAGWITGLLAAIGMGFLAHISVTSEHGSLPAFVLATIGRYIIPALLAAIADFLVRKYWKAKK
ncbi:hypothetical protein [Arthrobacter sp. NIO-1057]|uniref:hypothetical protein n=1 Tax=Arthrobacter sp. NIO-1057 TaxID=993071 RepID=UPI00071E3517|nr:hypothetical protein [Arthrobacter sp. NIO-1057]KSU64212.1 hypothetical protein AS038_16010 [Arthrobacter sp. NIO-1057]SCC52318.1 hypothetical protein GA0061084_3276 [Arthrobacter sp. NIO-1057]